MFRTPGVGDFAEMIDEERIRQIEKWGPQQHPDGTGLLGDAHVAQMAQEACERATEDGTLTWRHIATEEFYEALAEKDSDKLITELTQAAAVIQAWISDIQRRKDVAALDQVERVASESA